MNDLKQDTGELNLEDILKEFGAMDEDPEVEVSEMQPLEAEEPAEVKDAAEIEPAEANAEAAESSDEAAPVSEEAASAPEEAKESTVSDDTIRLDDLAKIAEEKSAEADVTSETIRLDPSEIAKAEKVAKEAAPAQETAEPEPVNITPPPAPIVFDPKAKLRELKRKLVAGPERRYYELAEVGVGKVQMSMFLCLIVIGVSAGAAVMYGLDMIPENRMRLMVFGQVLAMLLGALLGSDQIVDGLSALLKGKFTANTLLTITFFACCADAVFCLQELRVPICAAFTTASSRVILPFEVY